MFLQRNLDPVYSGGEARMESAINCLCPSCGTSIEIKRPHEVVFETMRCPSCKVSLILKYDELLSEGEEDAIWWFETASS
jgi:hypothetical protein